jgi:regulator of protease activity HflC (stomatin/prohibitin superfamily)
MRSIFITAGAGALALASLTGCAGTTVEPGHRGLLFDPKHGGLQHEVLPPGHHRHGSCILSSACARVDDFDVTYSRKLEALQTNSTEGLGLDLKLTVVYRPIVAELYQLDTEIGPNYYEEVIGPEFRSAARGVFARYSYLDLQKKNEIIENEIEAQLRRRTAGKHVEISSVLLESVSYAPEIANAVRARLVGAEEAARLKAFQENDAARKKREMEIHAEQARMAAENDAAQKKLVLEQQQALEKQKMEQDIAMQRAHNELEASKEKARIELALSTKKSETELTQEEAKVARLRAESSAAAKVAEARGEATSRTLLAKASAEEHRAETASITPLHVMMHAYDALGKLGGTGTTIMLGDWSKVPNFLFPRLPWMNAMTMPWGPMAPPQVPAATSQAPAPAHDQTYSSTARPPR